MKLYDTLFGISNIFNDFANEIYEIEILRTENKDLQAKVNNLENKINQLQCQLDNYITHEEMKNEKLIETLVEYMN